MARTLAYEDRTVGAEQIFALHAGSAGAGADQERPVGAGKGYIRLVGQNRLREEGKGAVIQLHCHAFERAHRRRNLQQLEDNRLLRAEQIAVGDAKDKGIADISGRAGHCYTNWISHHSGVSWCGRGQWFLFPYITVSAGFSVRSSTNSFCRS